MNHKRRIILPEDIAGIPHRDQQLRQGDPVGFAVPALQIPITDCFMLYAAVKYFDESGAAAGKEWSGKLNGMVNAFEQIFNHHGIPRFQYASFVIHQSKEPKEESQDGEEETADSVDSSEDGDGKGEGSGSEEGKGNRGEVREGT